MHESAPHSNAQPISTIAGAPGASIAIAMHAVFDTGFVIDTFTLSPERYQQYGAQVRDMLARDMPDIEWTQEHAEHADEYDSLPESYPVLDLSFVMATAPTLLEASELQFVGADGAARTLALSQERVSYHAFKGGVFSVLAMPIAGDEWTLADWQAAETKLMASIAGIAEPKLTAMTAAVARAVAQAHVPRYHSRFLETSSGSTKRALFDWTHRVFIAQCVRPADVTAVAGFLVPLMKPIDQEGVTNMALSPDTFIYLGSGRSIIALTRETGQQRQSARAVATYLRILEVRQYVWRTLYDVDRSLRNAIALIRSTTAPLAARALVSELRELDLRVTGMLEELDPYKLTFDSESIWLMRQLDRNWLTADLVVSLRSRLASLNRAYEYHEETINRDREARLRAVLNLIGFVATAGSVAQIIGYFDPQNTQLADGARAILLIAGIAVIILVFIILLQVNLRSKRK